MKTSESILKIAPAYLKAQKEIGAATKGKVNPFFHSNYADLGEVMETCKKALNDNGISVLQPVGYDLEGRGYVETILLHESGEFFSDKMAITVKTANNPQDYGSAVTYARRYALQSMVFIPAEDDDGNKATGLQEAVKSPMARFDEKMERQDVCQHPPDQEKIIQVTKESANKGKSFRSCGRCHKFLGWASAKTDPIEDSIARAEKIFNKE